MHRREFLRSGLMSAALAASPAAEKRRAPQRPAPAKGRVELANEHVAWRLDWRQGRLASTRWTNKRTGTGFPLTAEREFAVTFAAAEHRAEIPWWRFAYGPDEQPVSAEDETGFRLGFALAGFDDRDWGYCENLLLRGLRNAPNPRGGTKYDGYGWFRALLELPAGGRGKDIHFVLGGYDFLDWQEYWVYVNGAMVSHRASSGRWRKPGHFRLKPSDLPYGWLRFGPNEKNLLAVRTRGYDKHFGGYSDDVIRHYVFEPVLADQFVTVGPPHLRAEDWRVIAWDHSAPDRAVFLLKSPSVNARVQLHYELDGPTRRKWLEIENSSDKEMLLLDAEVDNFGVDVEVSEGGQGEPVFIGDQAFAALEHPAGLNQGFEGQVRLLHFPGRKLAPGAAWRSHTALASVAKNGEALDSFLTYVQERSPRKKKLVSLYTPFGINNQWGGCPTLDDNETLRVLDRLGEWQKEGIKFDYFTLDWGWVDQSSDMTRFAPQCYPHGEKKIVERVRELGMKFGLWYSVAYGGKSIGENPAVAPSFIPRPGDPEQPQPSTPSYRNGYLADGGAPEQLCVASEPYFTLLRNAILYQIRENGLKFFKLDMGNYHCNSTHHAHLPGKYSTEAMYDRLLEIARAARAAEPDIYVMWYWGLRSPFFALHGDSIFETKLFMEGSGTSWYPALYYRDSVTLNLDQSTRFASTIPPINKDSLGVWISDIRWGNFMGNERWREALVMDLGRGNLLFPQIWSNLFHLDDGDVEFLRDISAFAKQHEAILLSRRRNIGDPWKNEVYGYAYGLGGRGLVFLNNVHFTARQAPIRPGPEMGIELPAGTPLELRTWFPDERRIVREDGAAFRAGEVVPLGLRPFEILMLEIRPAGESATHLSERQAWSRDLEALGTALVLDPKPLPPELNLRFADAARFERAGHRGQAVAWESKLPWFDNDRMILAIAVRLLKDGAEWHYVPTVAEIVQVVARLGDQKVQMIPVPDARQFGNTQKLGASWVVYKVRLGRKWSGEKLSFAVHASLPPGVESAVNAWVLEQWWRESPGPRGDGYYGDSPS
jgi:hypothetical protein